MPVHFTSRNPARVIALGLFASGAAALDLASEERGVSVSAGAGLASVWDSDSAPDLNPWDGAVEISYNDEFTFEGGSASATQSSSLDQGLQQWVRASGSLFAFGSTDGFAAARSTLTTSIESERTQPFSIYGEITSLIGASGSNASIRMVNANGVTRYHLDEFDLGLYTDGTTQFRLNGVMPQGVWSLQIVFSASGFEGAADQIDYDVAFFLPSPAAAPLMGLGLLATTRRRR